MRRASHAVRAFARWWCASVAVAALILPLAAPTALAQTTDPLLEFLKAAAQAESKFVVIDGDRVTLVDPRDDQTNATGTGRVTTEPQNDLLAVERLAVDSAATDLLANPFVCDGSPEHVCSNDGSDASAFGQGAMLLYQGLDGDPRERDLDLRYEWAILGRDPDFEPPPTAAGQPNDVFDGAVTHLWLVQLEGANAQLSLLIYANGQFDTFRTHARAVLTEDGIFWLIPTDKEWGQISEFDVYAFVGDAAATGFDTLRQPPAQSEPMLPVTPAPLLTVSDEPAPTPTPSPTSAPTTTPTSSRETSPTATAESSGASGATPTPTPGADGDPASERGSVPWTLLTVFGLILTAIALWLLFGRRGGPPPTPSSEGPGSLDGPPPTTGGGPPAGPPAGSDPATARTASSARPATAPRQSMQGRRRGMA